MMRKPIHVQMPGRTWHVEFVRFGGHVWSADIVAADRETAAYEATFLLAYARHHELAIEFGYVTPEREWRVIDADGEHPLPPVR